VPRHVARLVTQLVVDYSASRRLVVDYSASRRLARGSSLVVNYSASRRLVARLVAPLVVDYFSYAARPGARHVARPVTRLIVDYFVRRDFILRPRWLYFSHAVCHDYLSRGNPGSTSSTLRAATTSSSGRITSTIHLD
jgi:hypothetical protein